MKFSGLLLVLGASLVASAPSTLDPIAGARQHPSAVQGSRYFGPSGYPGYYIYNYLQIDQNRGIPIAVQPIYNYFGTPVYDYVYVSQIYPGFLGFQPPSAAPDQQPPLTPAQGPIYPPTTQRPIFDVDDGIEKLDEKVDPSLEGTSHPNDDDDTVTIDAI